MTGRIFRRPNNAALGLVPANDEAVDAMRRIRPGDEVFIEIRRPRSMKQHRLYWKLLTVVQEHCSDRWPTKEALHAAVKIALGHFDAVQASDGSIFPLLKPTDVASMPADDFLRYLTDTITLITTVIIPDIDRQDLMREINEMVGN